MAPVRGVVLRVSVLPIVAPSGSSMAVAPPRRSPDLL
jgi:hypothetical protein